MEHHLWMLTRHRDTRRSTRELVAETAVDAMVLGFAALVEHGWVDPEPMLEPLFTAGQGNGFMAVWKMDGRRRYLAEQRAPAPWSPPQSACTTEPRRRHPGTSAPFCSRG